MLKQIFPILLILVITSCVKDVDFEQAEDLSISPVLESSLLFFNFPASEFQEPTGTAIVVVQDELELDVFNDEFLRDNLIRAEFFFEVTNSIDRNFRADIIMYDANGGVTHAFDISIAPDGNNEVVVTHTELFENATLDQLKNTTRMRHLWNNTIPLFLLSAAVIYFYRSQRWTIFIVGLLGSGFITWIIGREANHIGASGFIYVLVSFIFFKGIITKYYRFVAVSLIIMF